MYRIVTGDCRELLNDVSDVSAVITDPPYGLEIGRTDWDGDVPSSDTWLRVRQRCRPGALLLAFGHALTYHHLATAVEAGGWKIMPMLAWIYGNAPAHGMQVGAMNTRLRNAVEPICCALNPPSTSLRECIEQTGLAGFRVDAARIPSLDGHGRFPSNVILDDSDSVQLAFPFARSGSQVTGDEPTQRAARDSDLYGRFGARKAASHAYGDDGSASRFFYCARASRAEKHAAGPNPVPTVKPVALMQYLVELACPPGGLVLDPFCGSGSTGIAVMRSKQGRRFVGIEARSDHAEYARRRCELEDVDGEL